MPIAVKPFPTTGGLEQIYNQVKTDLTTALSEYKADVDAIMEELWKQQILTNENLCAALFKSVYSNAPITPTDALQLGSPRTTSFIEKEAHKVALIKDLNLEQLIQNFNAKKTESLAGTKDKIAGLSKEGEREKAIKAIVIPLLNDFKVHNPGQKPIPHADIAVQKFNHLKSALDKIIQLNKATPIKINEWKVLQECYNEAENFTLDSSKPINADNDTEFSYVNKKIGPGFWSAIFSSTKKELQQKPLKAPAPVTNAAADTPANQNTTPDTPADQEEVIIVAGPVNHSDSYKAAITSFNTPKSPKAQVDTTKTNSEARRAKIPLATLESLAEKQAKANQEAEKIKKTTPPEPAPYNTAELHPAATGTSPESVLPEFEHPALKTPTLEAMSTPESGKSQQETISDKLAAEILKMLTENREILKANNDKAPKGQGNIKADRLTDTQSRTLKEEFLSKAGISLKKDQNKLIAETLPKVVAQMAKETAEKAEAQAKKLEEESRAAQKALEEATQKAKEQAEILKQAQATQTDPNTTGIDQRQSTETLKAATEAAEKEKTQKTAEAQAIQDQLAKAREDSAKAEQERVQREQAAEKAAEAEKARKAKADKEAKDKPKTETTEAPKTSTESAATTTSPSSTTTTLPPNTRRESLSNTDAALPTPYTLKGPELVDSKASLKKYIDNKTTKNGKPVELHKGTYGRSDQFEKKKIAEDLLATLNANNSAVKQLLEIRKAIRENAKQTGKLAHKGHLHEILTQMQEEVLSTLDNHPRERAIAELQDYLLVTEEEKKGRKATRLGFTITDLGKKQNLAKSILQMLINEDNTLSNTPQNLLNPQLDVKIKENKDKNMTVPTPWKESRLNKILEDLRDEKKYKRKSAPKTRK